MNIDKLDTLANASRLSVADYLKEVICRGWAAFYPINYPTPNGKGQTRQQPEPKDKYTAERDKQLEAYMQANNAKNQVIEEDLSLYEGLL